jgi:hypothetical protein
LESGNSYNFILKKMNLKLKEVDWDAQITNLICVSQDTGKIHPTEAQV